jgi:hypothetical protein
MATSRASTQFDVFMSRAWNDHATRSDAVARRLRTRTPPPQTPAQVAQLVRFVVHLLGEHLGRFDDARWRLDALRTHSMADAEVQSALQVAEVTLDIGKGRADTAQGLDAAQAVRAEAAAAALCLGRGQVSRAEQLLARARERIAALSAPTPQDHRPLAVACNNMTWTLYDLGDARSAEQTAAMLRLAAASREHWSRAGGWLEIERAEYALALTHLSAGLHDDAWRHAGQCLAVCLHHAAPPSELVSAHEAMARVHHARREAGELAHHAQALQAAFARLSADDQAACQGVRDAVLSLRTS